ncbi:hypothetical protein MNBD_NITROSPINAE01-1459 [hydrothermal vent metagenome]|uniref:Amidohydrolase-related domain-containing protein n=1 Tax=hydrothermal vent metagenome TaxID=652676 RepID=A0A3B1BPP8_9ZZZZ
MSAKTVKITARKIIVDSKTILDDATVIIKKGAVAKIGPAETLSQIKTDRVINLKNHILHPGFVNAHCHLDLSFLKGKLKQGAPFTSWIRSLVAKRVKATMQEIDNGIKNGIKQLISTGTTSVGDISSTGRSPSILAHSGMRAILFHETLGYNPPDAISRFNDLKQILEKFADSDLLKSGVSPHAIYSVSPALFKKVSAYAKKNNLPVAIHMAETEEEIEFSKKGTGPFRELLISFGSFAPGRYPKTSPVGAVANFNGLKNSILIHANHISNADIAKIKKAHATIVICPNSNRWFKRPISAPVGTLLDNGVPLALGTDSLASNYALDMTAEIREFHKKFPDISLHQLFDMATNGGALALGLKGGTGTLAVKAPFDAVAIKMPKNIKTDPIKAIITSRRKIAMVWINGTAKYKNMENMK